MADDRIFIQINLDDAEIIKTFESINTKAKSAGEEIEQNINRGFEGISVSSKKVLASFEKTEDAIKDVSDGIGNAVREQSIFNKILSNSVTAALALGALFDEFTAEASKLFAGFAGQITGLNKGILGLVTNIAAIGSIVEILGDKLAESENAAIRALGEFLKLGGFIAGGFSFALTLAVVKLGELLLSIGNKLVNANIKAAESFARFEKAAFIFSKTIDSFNTVTGGAVGRTEEWTRAISGLSEELNLSQTSLQRAATEIVTVGTRLGLTQGQLQELLRVTAEFSKLTGKDVFDSSVKFVTALQGNAQAVAAFGVKLTEASNKQFLLKQGLTENFNTLTEGSKVQVRFQNLLSQFADVQGIAGSASETLAEQGEKLRVNQERLAVAFGRGTAIIENSNLVAFGLNAILNNVSDSVLEASGFISGLAGRALQATGFLLKFGFQILAVVKGIELLNLVLAKNSLQRFLILQIPVLNRSLSQLLPTLASVITSSKNTTSLFRGLSALIGRNVISSVVGLGAKILRLFRIFTPFGLILTAFIGGFTLLRKAFAAIEERTGALSILFDALKRVFTDVGGFLDPFKQSLDGVFNAVKKLAEKGFGILVFGLSKLLGLLTTVAKSNPFGVFSKKTVAAITLADNKLKEFNKTLAQNDFLLGKIGDRAPAAAPPPPKFTPSFSQSDLGNAIKNIQDFGKTEAQLLQEQADRRSLIIQAAVSRGVLTRERGNALILQNERNLQTQLQNLADKESGILNVRAQAIAGLTTIIKSGIASLGASLVQGGKAFDNFAKTVLGIMGDFLINFGFVLLGIGDALLKLVAAIKTFSGPLAIAAGIGLIALGGALKALAGGAGGIGTAGGGPSAVGAGGIETPIITEEEIESERQTAVTVNVEGTVIDPKTTGLQIAEILQEAFDSTGVQVVNT